MEQKYQAKQHVEAAIQRRSICQAVPRGAELHPPRQGQHGLIKAAPVPLTLLTQNFK